MTDRPNRVAALALLAEIAADPVPAERRPVRLTSVQEGAVTGARLDGLDKIARALGDVVQGASEISLAVETRPDGTARLAARARREASVDPAIDHEAERARLEFYRVARGNHG